MFANLSYIRVFLYLGITVGFTAPDYTVLESDGQVEVCVELSQGSLEREAIVTLSTADGSALGELDYILDP